MDASLSSGRVSRRHQVVEDRLIASEFCDRKRKARLQSAVKTGPGRFTGILTSVAGHQYPHGERVSDRDQPIGSRSGKKSPVDVGQWSEAAGIQRPLSHQLSSGGEDRGDRRGAVEDGVQRLPHLF
jgi:hypothetical protein